jgi:hypothetical protein
VGGLVRMPGVCSQFNHNGRVTWNTEIWALGIAWRGTGLRWASVGFRQIQMGVPDVRTEEFKREAGRQSLAVAAADRASDDQDFIEQISEDWPE